MTSRDRCSTRPNEQHLFTEHTMTTAIILLALLLGRASWPIQRYVTAWRMRRRWRRRVNVVCLSRARRAGRREMWR